MKILLATDGSRYALAAARALAGWFSWPGGAVDLLAVAPPDRPGGDRRPFGRDIGREREWKGPVGRWLSSTERRLATSGLRVSPTTQVGDPASVVPEVAAGGGYDLVVAGVKGRGREPHLRLGSVARALVEQFPTSLLLVRERVPTGRARRLPKPASPLQTVTVQGAKPASESLLAWQDRLTEAHVDRELREPSPAEMIEAAEDADLVLIDAGVRGAGDVAEQCPCSVLLVRKPTRREIPAGAEEPEEERGAPFQVSYEGVEPNPQVERAVLRGIERLERTAPDLIGVDVALALRSARRRKGNVYDVTLRLSVAGPDIIVSRTPPPRTQNENLVTAINGAFRTARRQLTERRALESDRVRTERSSNPPPP